MLVQKLKHFFLFLPIVALCACQGFPADPDHTLQKAKESELLVGVMIAPPWVSEEDNSLNGIEVNIVNGFAKHIGTKVRWVKGSEDDLMKLLEENAIHMVIGGVRKDTPWKTRVGLTNVYRKSNVYVCDPSGGTVSDLKGLSVQVRSNRAHAAYVRMEKAIPMFIDSTTRDGGLIAVNEFELQSLSCKTCCKIIKTEEHVLAVPKGENALLLTLEKYMNEKGHQELHRNNF